MPCLALGAFDRICGLELADIAVDGFITKAPFGGEVAGRSPVERGKQGLKRSLAVHASWIPLGTAAALANRNDVPLLKPTLVALRVRDAVMTVHLDRGYNSDLTRERLAMRGTETETDTSRYRV